MFWKKNKAEAPLKFPEPRELTGIEKAAIEEREKERTELERKDREERQKISARLIELRNQIKPQMDEIHVLEMRLYPYVQYVNAYSAIQGQLNVASGLSSLLGFGGVLHQ